MAALAYRVISKEVENQIAPGNCGSHFSMGVLLYICCIFQNTFFWEHLRTAASVST